jgi:hypothetical protein
MIVTQAVWSKITITYDKKVKGPGRTRHNNRQEIWENAQLFYEIIDDLPTLRIMRGDKHLFLIRAKVVSITPWDAKFEAHFFSGKPSGSKYDQLIRADINCEF